MATRRGCPGRSAGGGQPAGQTQFLGFLNGRDQQRPHAGGDHHPGGKAQKDTLDGRIELLSEQKDHGGAQSGHQKSEAGTVAAHKMDCMSSLLFLVSHS